MDVDDVRVYAVSGCCAHAPFLILFHFFVIIFKCETELKSKTLSGRLHVPHMGRRGALLASNDIICRYRMVLHFP